MQSSFVSLFRLVAMSMMIFASTLNADSLNDLPIRLSGHIPQKALSTATYLNGVDPSAEIHLTFVLPLRNQEELEELIQRLHDPNDELYGKFLTSKEFEERFAPTQEDYDRIVAYATELNLTIQGTHSNRTLLNVSGPAASFESAFDFRLHRFQKANGDTFHAPDQEPQVPSPVASVIEGIVGLDNHAIRHTHYQRKEALTVPLVGKAHATSHTFPSGPGGGFSPNDLLTAYNLNSVSEDGTDQTLALFELASYQVSDINHYTSYFGLPMAQLTDVLVDGGSGEGINAEVTLDIELALALAPKSKIYVYEGPNTDRGVLDTYNQIATDNIAKQVSTSWGLGESFSSAQFLRAENAIFLQMAAQGQTIYAAAGDSGAYDEYPYNSTLVVDDPASQPYVVGVGGTRLTVNPANGAYGAEFVWNNGLGNGAGGGGISGFWAIPSWQQNVSTLVSKTKRNVPDVALNADTNSGYSIYHDGQWEIYGGTSCAAPLWAAFTARVNQARVASMLSSLGFANPLFYAIGLDASYMDNFHDVTSGNNLHYSAGMKYDNASGWGSFNGAHLFSSLTGSTPPPPPPHLSPALSISLTPISSFVKGGKGTYHITVQNTGGGSSAGNVTVNITLPKELTIASLKGTGWTCNSKTKTCTRKDVVGTGASFPPIELKVKIARKVNAPVISTATVSGGGSTSNTVTSTITIPK